MKTQLSALTWTWILDFDLGFVNSQETVSDPAAMTDGTTNPTGYISSNSKVRAKEEDNVINFKPPDMISEASQFSLYKTKLSQ